MDLMLSRTWNGMRNLENQVFSISLSPIPGHSLTQNFVQSLVLHEQRELSTGGDFTILICFLVFMGFMIFADIDTQRKCPKNPPKNKNNATRKLVALISVIRDLSL